MRQTGSSRRRRALALLVAVAAAGAALWALLRSREDRQHPEIHGASWIWFSYGSEASEPIRFFAGREFSWNGAAGRSQALVFVDRRYVLSLNGQRVGAGGQKPGDRLDAYDVTPLLRLGVNRVVIEAHSETGVGAILFSLALPSADRIVSDRSWRVSEVEEDLFSKGAAPIVWGRPPMYPWGYPAPPAPTAAATSASNPIRAAAQ